VTGATPDDLSRLRTAIRRGAEPIFSVPQWLHTVIVRGLREDPAARWSSMTALITALEHGLGARRRFAARAALLAVVATIAWIAVRDDRVAVTHEGRATPAPSTPTTTWVETPLTFRGDIAAASISPDGSTIAAFAGDDLISLPTGGGDVRIAARAIHRTPSSTRPIWLPDGRILFRRDGQNWGIRLSDGLIYEIDDGARGLSIPMDDGYAAFFATNRAIDILPRDWTQQRSCAIAGTYEWMLDLAVEENRFLVEVQWPDATRALLSTAVTCGATETILDRRVANGFTRGPDERRYQIDGPEGRPETITELDDRGVPIGPRIPLPSRVSAVVGIDSNASVVLVRRIESWRLVEIVDGAPHEIARGTGTMDLRLSPDGRRAVILDRETRAGGSLYVLDVDHLEQRGAPLATGCQNVAWSPDGTTLAVICEDDDYASIGLLDAISGRRSSIRCRRAALDEKRVTTSGRYGLVWLDNRRVAYLRADHRTYAWVDREDCKVGELFDPQRGWTFAAAVSPTNGAIALRWNRSLNGTWLVPAEGAPRFLGGDALFAWGTNGLLYQTDGATITRYDRDLQQRRPIAKLTLEPGASIEQLFPRGDRLWVLISNIQSDLVRYSAGPSDPR
jgi:hypothetical protein